MPEPFKVGDGVRAPWEKHHVGKVVAVDLAMVKIEWEGIAAHVRKQWVPFDGVELIPPPPTTVEAEHAVLRNAMAWFAGEEGTECLAIACAELRAAREREGAADKEPDHE